MTERGSTFNTAVVYKTLQCIHNITFPVTKSFWDILYVQLSKLDVRLNCEFLGPLFFNRTM
jgi:hypothetical protein